MWKFLVRRRKLQLAGRPAVRRRRLNLEQLEAREVPAVITVTSLADVLDPNATANGIVTLPEAVVSMDNGADFNAAVAANRTGSYGTNNTIVFAASLGNGAITLNVSSENSTFPIEDSTFGPTALIIGSFLKNPGPLTINGQTGPNTGITLDGNNEQRIFGVLSNGSLTLENITLQHGEAVGGNGGSSATAGGGGGAAGLGGAIFVSSGSLTVLNCTFVSNSAVGGNGGAGGNDSAGLGGGGGGGGGAGGAGGTGAAQGGGGGGGGVTTAGENGAIGVGGDGGGGDGGNVVTAESDGISGGGGGGANGNDGGSAGSGQDPSGGELGGGGGGGAATTGTPNYAGAGGLGGGGGAGINAGTGPVAASVPGNSYFGGGGGGGAAAPNESQSTGFGTGGFGGGNGGAATFTATTSSGGAGGGGLGAGGAIFTYGGTVSITNSTFYGNSVAGGTGANSGLALGGAIFDFDGSLIMTNATLSENRAGNGRDVYAFGNGILPAHVVINDSILGQTSAATPDYAQGALPGYYVPNSSGSHNLIRSTPAGANGFGGAFSTADPMVAALPATAGRPRRRPSKLAARRSTWRLMRSTPINAAWPGLKEASTTSALMK